MRPIITVFFFLLSLSSYAQDDRFECNDSCSAGSTGIATFNVVSPVGFSTVEPIEMAPRLSTLDGKTSPSWARISCITSPTPNSND